MATKELNAIEKIRSLQEQIQKHVEEVKTALARQLAETCETVKLLEELRVPRIFEDPQYEEYVSALHINTHWREVQNVHSANGTGKKAPKGATETAILKALQSGETNHNSLQAHPVIVEFYKSIGKEVPALTPKLDALIKDKKVIKTGERREAKYRLPK